MTKVVHSMAEISNSIQQLNNSIVPVRDLGSAFDLDLLLVCRDSSSSLVGRSILRVWVIIREQKRELGLWAHLIHFFSIPGNSLFEIILARRWDISSPFESRSQFPCHSNSNNHGVPEAMHK